MLVDRSIPSFTKLLWLGARNRGECAKLALRSWMAYVDQQDTILVTGGHQPEHAAACETRAARRGCIQALLGQDVRGNSRIRRFYDAPGPAAA